LLPRRLGHATRSCRTAGGKLDPDFFGHHDREGEVACLELDPGLGGSRVSRQSEGALIEVNGARTVTLIRKHQVAVAFAFYASDDGGYTWRLRSIRPVEFSRPGPNNPFSWYVPTSITSPTAWRIAAGRTHPSVAVTTDAGTTWPTHPTATPLRATTWDLSAADSDHAWLMTSTARSYDEAALYATANGGRTWERLTLPNR
jgi:hypothetical protein